MVECSKCTLRYHNKFPVNIDEVYNDKNYKNKSAGYWVDGEYDYRKIDLGKKELTYLKII